MENILCFTCGEINEIEYKLSPGLTRMKDWQDNLALFWGQYPWMFYLLRTTMLWFSLAVLCGYFDNTREYTSIFVLLTVLLIISSEYIPLTPIPFSVTNVVTSRKDSYTTAAITMVKSLILMFIIGMIMFIVEDLGNVAFHFRTDFTDSPLSYWSEESLPLLTVILIGCPLIYFMSLIVSTRFVLPYLNNTNKSIG